MAAGAADLAATPDGVGGAVLAGDAETDGAGARDCPLAAEPDCGPDGAAVRDADAPEPDALKQGAALLRELHEPGAVVDGDEDDDAEAVPLAVAGALREAAAVGDAGPEAVADADAALDAVGVAVPQPDPALLRLASPLGDAPLLPVPAALSEGQLEALAEPVGDGDADGGPVASALTVPLRDAAAERDTAADADADGVEDAERDAGGLRDEVADAEGVAGADAPGSEDANAREDALEVTERATESDGASEAVDATETLALPVALLDGVPERTAT